MKIIPSDNNNILEVLARGLGVGVAKGKVVIPGKYGSGYLHGFIFSPQFRMMIRNYELNRDVLIERANLSHSEDMILFGFQQHIQDNGNGLGKNLMQRKIPSVQITTRGLNTDLFFPGFINHRSVSIIMSADHLSMLVDPKIESPIIQSIIKNAQSLAFEEVIFPSVQKLLNEITSATVPDAFSDFYYKLKAEEVVLNLLIELVNREEVKMYSLNITDIKALYLVKDMLLERLDRAPSIKEMADMANMSASKLARLFKQVFGKSIFNYYQMSRMKEAARLLKMERLSVSQVGYQLGFSNLSHFSRIFEEHIGVKPKKYSSI